MLSHPQAAVRTASWKGLHAVLLGFLFAVTTCVLQVEMNVTVFSLRYYMWCLVRAIGWAMAPFVLGYCLLVLVCVFMSGVVEVESYMARKSHALPSSWKYGAHVHDCNNVVDTMHVARRHRTDCGMILLVAPFLVSVAVHACAWWCLVRHTRRRRRRSRHQHRAPCNDNNDITTMGSTIVPHHLTDFDSSTNDRFDIFVRAATDAGKTYVVSVCNNDILDSS
jgi:hypothetical protein